MTFDTLAYAKRLKEAGFSEKQSEVQAEALAELVNDKLATKRDIHDLRRELKRDNKELEMRLIFKLTGILVITLGLFSTLMGVFIKLVR